ncbi:DUF5329 domain-containing protein [Pelomonas sp. KK5]|uniref:DUF5329 domain-containing protein n=1 Tax=Pelomonas sp. KK5 TaxID=1855730 RepID=UPI00097C267A|nr:DUF5329 domain-containing protein [Pelomonas sp. KK5]
MKKRTPRFSTLIGAALLILGAGSALAAGLPAAARTEIDGLLNRLQNSGCEFKRNGSWYGATEARAHLQKKLDYLVGKDAVHSAEQFIELGASSSSMSGQPYEVRCTGAAPVPSRDWLGRELKALRAGAAR